MTTATLPRTMRAWTYNSGGPPRSVLSLNSSYPAPTPPSGSNLLIRISHASLTPGSLFIISTGIFPLLRHRSAPGCIPEFDFSGTVHLAGPAAPDRFKTVGTKVFGSLAVQSWEAVRGGRGTLAEFVVVRAEDCVVLPQGMSLRDAGGLNGNAQTAVKMCETAGIKPGLEQRVLINGASGGVGTMACQVARAMGASEVVAVCSGANVEMVKQLGVDEVIDYQARHPLHTYLATNHHNRHFDIILDTIGIPSLYENSAPYLKPTGLYINIGAFEGALWTIWCWTKNTIWPQFLGGTPRRYVMFSTIPNSELAEKVARLVEQGELKVVVDSIYEMEDVLAAYDRLASKRARGKIIVKVRHDD